MTTNEKIERDVRGYFKYNQSETFCLAFRGLTHRQTCDQKAGKKGNTPAEQNCLNIICFKRSWIENNFPRFLTLFAWHEGQTKTDRIVIDTAIKRINGNNVQNVDNIEGVWIETFNRPYDEIQLCFNGTRSEPLEKAICERLEYEWVGNEKSAYFDHETGKRLIDPETGEPNAWRYINPDGKKTVNGETVFLEVKCVCGRFTPHSNRRKNKKKQE